MIIHCLRGEGSENWNVASGVSIKLHVSSGEVDGTVELKFRESHRGAFLRQLY